MRRPRAAQRPRGGADTRPDARADNRAASRVNASTTARNDRAQQASATDPLTDAEVLVGSTSWLLSLRDWLAEELGLADGETVQLRRADVEKVRGGAHAMRGLPRYADGRPGAAPAPRRRRA